MNENLKIALRRQKKLILIFLVTIVLPSVALGIFGILAIRNEQFRLVKQRENEQRSVVDLLKMKVQARIASLGRDLQTIVTDPLFSTSKRETFVRLVKERLVENPLVEQVFLLRKEGEPVFPLFRGEEWEPAPVATSFIGNDEKELLRKAQQLEHVGRDYAGAAKLYEGLFRQARTRNEQAHMLSNRARNLMKLGQHRAALAAYSRIASDYPEARTSSGVPLSLVARLGIVDCYRSLGDMRRAAEQALEVYKDILLNYGSMGENAFRAHATLARDAIRETQNELWRDSSGGTDYETEVKRLDLEYQGILHQWRVVGDLERECSPELQRRLMQADSLPQPPVLYTKAIDTSDVLIVGVVIPPGLKENSAAMLGVKIRNEYLEGALLDEIVEEAGLSERDTLTISTLSGRMLYGGYPSSTSPVKTIAFMEENFPPWRIELVDLRTERAGIADVYTSFYFWTILTLIVVLASGLLLVARTVIHEMEVLKIKSDFVSSVSHEFKTPLTSIKTLTERLLNDKVRHPVKMKEYFSIIAEDTERLTQLVGNLLDFSKIEEGRKEYQLVETDVAEWLQETIESYRKERIRQGVQIRLSLADDMAHVNMDRAAMAQAVRNLLDNAVKFSPGRKEIDVVAEKDGASVSIRVKDYGIGISREELGKIFEKFYQGKDAAKYSGRGTGLGLTLVKHTVEAHGGSVSVASREGEGSTFSLSLPIGKKNP